jgi:hypothetical protein
MRAIARFMKKEGFKHIRYDLPFFDYRISAYGCCKKTQKTMAVVLCFDDWQHAKGKAEIFQACADYVLVASYRHLDCVDSAKLFDERGIGLILIHSSTWCEVVRAAWCYVLPNDKMKAEFLNLLTGMKLSVEESNGLCAEGGSL